MRIPAEAIIPDGRISRYLLVPKVSGDKSEYLARGGFNQANAAALEAEIRSLTAKSEAVVDCAKQQGTYYDVVGSLIEPAGAELPVKLVWLRRLDGVFSFVRLIPQAGS